MKTIISILLLVASLSAQAVTLDDVVKRECFGETYVEINGVVAPCVWNGNVIVFDTSNRWAEAIAEAIELGDKTKLKGVVVLIGTQQDEGYKKAHKLIYGMPLPVGLNSLKLKYGI